MPEPLKATDGAGRTPDSQQHVAYSRLMVASLIGMMLFAATIAVPSICLKQIADEFGLSLSARGLLGSLRTATLVIALLTCGYFAERKGKRFFLAGGVFLLGAGMAASAVAGGYAALVVAQLLVGVATGALEGLLNPLVAELAPRDTARYLNVANGLFSVGLVVSALTAGEILERGGSWRTPFLLWGLPALVAAILFATRSYPRQEVHPEPGGQLRGFFADPLFWLLMGAMVLGGGCESGMTFWGANFMEEELEATARSGAGTIAVYGAFMALGRFASGAVVVRVSPVRMMIASGAACALSTAGLAWVTGIPAAWAIFAMGGFFVACFWPTILAVASDHLGQGSTTLFALMAAAGITGCVIFPGAIGLIGDWLGLRAGMMLLPVSMILEVFVLLLVSRLLVAREDAAAAPPALC